MTLTLVYTGPSLHPSEAQSIFKDAHIFNPIRCGDLIKAMRLNPNRVVIIDGYFEQTGSIWHKEILYALSRGVRVYGSSSMGALRAAELAPFGMQGYGKIYETYASGALIDDDEVSLVHDSDFKTRVPALINVRFTLEKAIKLGEISPDEAEKIITDLKALPYYDRVFFESLKDDRFAKWCQTNYVDQKRIDAIELLNHLQLNQLPGAAPPTQPFAGSLFFNKIFREMIAAPFTEDHPALPLEEKALLALPKSPYWPTWTRLAKLLHIGFDLSRFHRADIIPLAHPILSFARQFKLETVIPVSDSTLLHHLCVLDGYDFSQQKEIESNLPLQRCLNFSVTLIKAIYRHMMDLNLTLQDEQLQLFADHFRRKHQLFEIDQTYEWLKRHNLPSLEAFSEFISTMGVVHLLVDQHNIGLTKLETYLEPIPWLSFAYQCAHQTASESAFEALIM